MPVYAIKASRWRNVVNFAPRPLYPLYLGFAPQPAWTFLRRLVKIGVVVLNGEEGSSVPLRNVGVTLHKTVTIVYDLNTLTSLNNAHTEYNQSDRSDRY